MRPGVRVGLGLTHQAGRDHPGRPGVVLGQPVRLGALPVVRDPVRAAVADPADRHHAARRDGADQRAGGGVGVRGRVGAVEGQRGHRVGGRHDRLTHRRLGRYALVERGQQRLRSGLGGGLRGRVGARGGGDAVADHRQHGGRAAGQRGGREHEGVLVAVVAHAAVADARDARHRRLHVVARARLDAPAGLAVAVGRDLLRTAVHAAGPGRLQLEVRLRGGRGHGRGEVRPAGAAERVVRVERLRTGRAHGLLRHQLTPKSGDGSGSPAPPSRSCSPPDRTTGPVPGRSAPGRSAVPVRSRDVRGR